MTTNGIAIFFAALAQMLRESATWVKEESGEENILSEVRRVELEPGFRMPLTNNPFYPSALAALPNYTASIQLYAQEEGCREEIAEYYVFLCNDAQLGQRCWRAYTGYSRADLSGFAIQCCEAI